jgi:hypothetical protein
MDSATRRTEITIRTDNESASLSKLVETAASCGAGVLAACSYRDRTGAVVKLVTDATDRTALALEAAGFRCTTTPIVLVEAPDRPELAALLGEKLADADIGVLYSYIFRSENNRSYVVFKTTDDDRAVYMLGAEALIRDLAAAKSWRGDGADHEHQVAAQERK